MLVSRPGAGACAEVRLKPDTTYGLSLVRLKPDATYEPAYEIAARTSSTASGRRDVTASADDGIFFQVWDRDGSRGLPDRGLRIELERPLQVRRLVAWEGDRIDAGIAGRAVLGAAAIHSSSQPVEAQIRHAVSVQILADLLERVRGGDELGPARRIDAVEARRDRRRTTDA